jgi:putative SOS response-associated peptidase YedK
MFAQLTIPDIVPRYNIAPTQNVLCVRNREGENEMVTLRWGLVPFWAKDLKIGAKMINARGETVAEKPAFRAAFKKRRCLVVADGFYEWKKEADGKQPFYITRADDQPFCMAGLWESWTDKSDAQSKPVETCTVITTDANELMLQLHDRMPVILEPDEYDFWLDPEFSDRQPLEAALDPFPNEEMKFVPVSKVVNKATNEVPECIVPLAS